MSQTPLRTTALRQARIPPPLLVSIDEGCEKRLCSVMELRLRSALHLNPPASLQAGGETAQKPGPNRRPGGFGSATTALQAIWVPCQTKKNPCRPSGMVVHASASAVRERQKNVQWLRETKKLWWLRGFSHWSRETESRHRQIIGVSHQCKTSLRQEGMDVSVRKGRSILLIQPLAPVEERHFFTLLSFTL